MSYNKGDLVIVNGYATGYGSLGIIVKGDCIPGGVGVAKVLFEGEVVFMPHSNIKKAEHNDAKDTHIQAR